MKLLDCRDVLPDCAMIFTGADDDEVIGHAARHAARSHGLDTGAAEIVSVFRRHIVPLA